MKVMEIVLLRRIRTFDCQRINLRNSRLEGSKRAECGADPHFEGFHALSYLGFRLLEPFLARMSIAKSAAMTINNFMAHFSKIGTSRSV